MLRITIYALYLIICAGAFATYVSGSGGTVPSIVQQHPFAAFVVLLVASQLIPLVDWVFPRKRIEIISSVYFGLLVGILLSFLLMLAISPALQPDFEPGVRILVVLAVTYGCISMLIQTRNDFRFVIPYVEFSRELKGGTPLILDASALIDGRIADVVETRIIDADVFVPQFVLHEVQEIADSKDKMRRTRGRRGLEVLGKLQNSPHVEVRVLESEDPAFAGLSVDQRLVEIAKQNNGRVITSDFNLNKVASLQGIPVINLNDVANALKPRYIPGDRLKVTVIKEGESPGQGVGYLDDGTMVVIEAAAHLINRQIDVIVTSVLQSSAGRMIFGRQVHQAGGASEERESPGSSARHASYEGRKPVGEGKKS